MGQETFTVKGLVIDADTRAPLAGASIVGKEFYAVSASDGEFTLTRVPGGNREFEVSYLGYASERVVLHVDSDITRVTIVLKSSGTELRGVEVYGKSHERRARENPVGIIEVSREFMEANRENSLMQTLSRIPGVTTINIGSGQSKPVIRGLGFNRVSVVQNGIKHEAQQWGSDHGLEIDQYDVERVRVVKGPASLLYGSDALAGVVDIPAPAMPGPHSFSGSVNLLGETNNNLLGISAGVTGRKEKWYYRGRLTFRDYADYKVPADRINFEGYIFELHKRHLRNTAGEEANASFSVGYTSDNITSETFFSNVYAKNGFFANAHGLEVRSSEIDYDRSARDTDLPFHQVNHFKITNNTTITIDDHTLDIDLGFQNNWREEHSEPVPHGHMPKPDDSREREFRKQTYTLNAGDTYVLGTHTLAGGINLELQENSIGGWGFLIPAYTRFTAGIFAYDQFEVRPGLHLQAGLRYDYGMMKTRSYYDWFPTEVNHPDGTSSSEYLQRAVAETLHFDNISASAGISYLSGKTTYKINLGKSFRIPLANELASDGVNYHMYRFEKGRADLDPESSYQLDVDVSHEGEGFHFGISPFVNWFDNYIYLNPTSSYYETLQVYEYTQSEVFRIGGEVSAGTTLFGRLHIDLSGEYVHSRQRSGPKKGFTLPFSPPLSGLLSVRYGSGDFLFFRQPVFTADYKVAATQDEIVPPEESTRGYEVLNLSWQTDMDLFRDYPPVGLRLKVSNVLDTRYYNHTSFYRLIAVPEAGRNLSLSLTIPIP
ncbi:TonB-dependent receptor [Sinomicrobium soli]|uniref:TonB-dependent receptor n=1 Tax=Sinomicrobium sp. N-1-3-6 TaxID=2219864 RepID=UPI001F18CE25|nr:TonB-dependent receptor [Sinomicrobium sp. N-1-3-6]